MSGAGGSLGDTSLIFARAYSGSEDAVDATASLGLTPDAHAVDAAGGGGGTGLLSTPTSLAGFSGDEALRRRMEVALLVRLRHARGCDAPGCAADRRLEAHARCCKVGQACHTKLCWPARCLMAHFVHCSDAACPVCEPVRRSPPDRCRSLAGDGRAPTT
jgi:hypothetical protein